MWDKNRAESSLEIKKPAGHKKRNLADCRDDLAKGCQQYLSEEKLQINTLALLPRLIPKTYNLLCIHMLILNVV